MNLHKAKGLEADVVFLADPDGGFKPRVDVHIERTGLKARGWLKMVRKTEGSFAVTLLGEHADWAAHEAAEMPYLSSRRRSTAVRRCNACSRDGGNQSVNGKAKISRVECSRQVTSPSG